MSDPVHIVPDKDGALLSLTLSRPHANIIDAEMIAALDDALAQHTDDSDMKGVMLTAEGPNFSFGASVEEHLPDQCSDMLKGMHALIRRMINFPVPILVAVEGQCLGGGLEVAIAGSLLFVSPGAKLGQPEIKLGVFAPAASCLLPELVNRRAAEELLLSGRTLSAEEAKAIGLVFRIADSPADALLDYFDEHIAPKSASTIRLAQRAVRQDHAARVSQRLDEVEDLYLTKLMATNDAVEGLNAFLEKREVRWENR